MNGNLKIPLNKVANNLTLNVEFTGVRVFWLRFWLGVQLIRLATRVIGCGVHISQVKK